MPSQMSAHYVYGALNSSTGYNAEQWLHIVCANLQLNGALMQQQQEQHQQQRHQQQQQQQRRQRRQQMASCIAMVSSSSHSPLSLPLAWLTLRDMTVINIIIHFVAPLKEAACNRPQPTTKAKATRVNAIPVGTWPHLG